MKFKMENKYIICIILLSIILLGSIIGFDISLFVIRNNKIKYNEIHTINTTCYIISYSINPKKSYYTLDMFLLQNRSTYNYTENITLAAKNKDEAETFIKLFPRSCYYIDNGSILFYYDLNESALPIPLIIVCCIVYNLIMIGVTYFLIISYRQKLKYVLIN